MEREEVTISMVAIRWDITRQYAWRLAHRYGWPSHTAAWGSKVFYWDDVQRLTPTKEERHARANTARRAARLSKLQEVRN